ncbi:MAG: carboxymuconolactone decarboxylase family protein [Moraxellaceae bacterium]|nr:carboxymuconolactone decarboxylase family protein [Moraxellaceae bacterium]
MPTFNKRTFDLATLASSLTAAAASAPRAWWAQQWPATSRALQEQVMLAVSSVTQCRYCTWVHAGAALEAGVDLEQLQHLLAEESLQNATSKERIAILFAQHYADTGGHPTGAAVSRLYCTLSRPEYLEVMALIDTIYFSNLAGNSMDAVIARLKGQKVENGHLLAEVLAAAVAWPTLGVVWLRSRRQRQSDMAAL